MKYKSFLILVSMFLVISGSEAQTEQYCVRYPYNTQVGINFNVNLLSKMKIERIYRAPSSFYVQAPSEYFYSHPSFGADVGVYLYQRVYKWFGIQTGLEYNAITIRYNFADDRAMNKNYYANGAFTFPILFNASYYFNERHGLDISFGGAPLILFAKEGGMWVGFVEGEFEGEEILNEFSINNHHSPFNFSLYGKIGYNFLFKNKNTLGMAIVGSYAADPYAIGDYKMRYGKVEQGRTSLYNTFVGLQFSYGFTMKKLLCNP